MYSFCVPCYQLTHGQVLVHGFRGWGPLLYGIQVILNVFTVSNSFCVCKLYYRRIFLCPLSSANASEKSHFYVGF